MIDFDPWSHLGNARRSLEVRRPETTTLYMNDLRAKKQVIDALHLWIDWYDLSGFSKDAPIGNYFAGYLLAKTSAAIAMEGDDATMPLSAPTAESGFPDASNPWLPPSPALLPSCCPTLPSARGGSVGGIGDCAVAAGAVCPECADGPDCEDTADTIHRLHVIDSQSRRRGASVRFTTAPGSLLQFVALVQETFRFLGYGDRVVRSFNPIRVDGRRARRWLPR